MWLFVLFAGLAFGLSGLGLFALVAGRGMRGLLYSVAPADGWTYVVALMLLFVATAIAAFLPARRAGESIRRRCCGRVDRTASSSAP
jgi:VIT1/CCC1 family predicted Fe2+/Mn2+ transporter